MGQRLVACADAYDDLMVAATFDRNTSTGSIAECEVLIDFSLPDATDQLLTCLHGHQTALVTGVTGRNRTQAAQIEALAKTRAIFSAANFSVGVSVLNHLVSQAVQMLGPNYVSEVFEIHHSKKEDAPSGTALLLAETACRSAGYSWPEARKNREGHTGPRGECEVGTAALRGGQVAGEHTVFLFGAADRLELTHRATDRDVFVHGALHSGKMALRPTKGHYGMQHLMGLFSPDKRPE